MARISVITLKVFITFLNNLYHKLRIGCHNADLKPKAVGLNLDQIMIELQTEGVDKFVKPFASLMASLENKVKQLTPA